MKIFFAVRSGGDEPMSSGKASIASSHVVSPWPRNHLIPFDRENFVYAWLHQPFHVRLGIHFFCPPQGIQVRVAMLVQFVCSHFLGIQGQLGNRHSFTQWQKEMDIKFGRPSLRHYPVHNLKQLYFFLHSAIILLPSDIHPVYWQGNCHHYGKRCTSTLTLFAHFCQWEYLSI